MACFGGLLNFLMNKMHFFIVDLIIPQVMLSPGCMVMPLIDYTPCLCILAELIVTVFIE